MIKTKKMMVLDNSHRITVTNLLTPNQSDGGDTLNPELLTPNQRTGTETLGNTTGFTNIGGSNITSSNEQAHTNTKSLKCTTPGTKTVEGVKTTNTTAEKSTTYIGSAWVYTPLGTTMLIAITDDIDTTEIKTFTGTGEWQYITVTMTTDTHTSINLVIRNTGTPQAITFYLDDLSLAKNDTTGYAAEIGTETLTVTGETSYEGYRSLKVVTAATANSGIKTTATSASESTTYTQQVWVKATAEKAMKFLMRNDDGSAIANTAFTATGDWDLVTVTGTTKAGATGVILAVTNDSAEEVTFYVDCQQLETGSKAHDWIIGQGSYSFFRSRE